MSEGMFHRLPIGSRKELNQMRHDDAWVAEWLDDLQRMTLAGLVQYPELAQEATGHLFSSECGGYLAVYRAIRGGADNIADITEKLLPKFGLGQWILMLADMLFMLASRSETRYNIETLKLFMSWNYRQEKAKMGKHE